MYSVLSLSGQNQSVIGEKLQKIKFPFLGSRSHLVVCSVVSSRTSLRLWQLYYGLHGCVPIILTKVNQRLFTGYYCLSGGG